MIISDDQLKTLLLEKNVVSEEKLNELLQFAKSSNTPLADTLIEKDVIVDEDLGRLLADFLKLPFATLSKTTIPEGIFHIVPERLARKEKGIAFARDQNGIKLAMADPMNKTISEMVAKKTGENVSVYFATERDIYNTLRIYRKDLQKAFDKFLKGGELALEHAPVAKIVDALIDHAYQDRASDIH